MLTVSWVSAQLPFVILVNAGPDQSLCNVSLITLNGNTPIAGTGTWNMISSPNAATINSPNTPASTISGIIQGTYVLSWNIVNGVCSVLSDTVQIDVFNLPTVADAGPDRDLCNISSITLAENKSTCYQPCNGSRIIIGSRNRRNIWST